jgi:hypothetical protein
MMMKRMIQTATIASMAALGLSLSACGDSKAENEIEKQAKAIDRSAEADADLMEAQAEGAPNENAVDAQADALRNEGEATKDHLLNLADELHKDNKANK